MQNNYACCLHFKVAAGLAQLLKEKLELRIHLDVSFSNYSRWLAHQSMQQLLS